jgi:rfaE bifunctional protein nucleotidyltransferase chain/domain
MEQLQNHHKIVKLDVLADMVGQLKKEGKKVVHCHGVFDLLHPGHIRHFEAARREGDVLVVTITQDRYVAKGPGRPVFNEHLRAESVAALQSVDYVAINEWPNAVDTIKKLQPDVYCKGSDYVNAKEDVTGKIVDEEEAIKSAGGRIHFTDEITFSSTKLINSHFDVVPDDARDYIQRIRDSYSSSQIIELLESLRDLKVLVIGDTIIDEYHYCQPLGKSPKENIIPARYLSNETFAGGVLAVANHVAGFCNEVEVLTCLGTKDNYGDFTLANLQPNIKSKFFYQPDSNTIVKRRFVEVDLFRKLFEVQFLNGLFPIKSVQEDICRYLELNAANYDLVIVGDYGHGLMSGKIIETLCDKMKFLAVNAQTNSANIGFNLITKYPRADYFCIDEPELRLATHDNINQLDRLLDKVAVELKCHRAVVTQGHRGSLVYNDGNGILEVPAFSREVVDRVGAGDAFLSLTAPCIAAGFPDEIVGFIGNAVGALAIRIVGNRSPVEPVSLFKYIKTLLK